MRSPARAFPIFVLAVSAAVLGAALLSQYWGGLLPCELCLTERWPWDVAIVIAFVATMAGSRAALPWVAWPARPGLRRQRRRWLFTMSGSSSIGSPARAPAPRRPAPPTTLEALKAQLFHQQPVRCDEPAWTVLGVSLAGWNLLASLAMTGICFVTARRRRAKGRGGAGRTLA